MIPEHLTGPTLAWENRSTSGKTGPRLFVSRCGRFTVSNGTPHLRFGSQWKAYDGKRFLGSSTSKKIAVERCQSILDVETRNKAREAVHRLAIHHANKL